jgi:hypothetical protein
VSVIIRVETLRRPYNRTKIGRAFGAVRLHGSE